jgi:hypothetical protein
MEKRHSEVIRSGAFLLWGMMPSTFSALASDLLAGVMVREFMSVSEVLALRYIRVGIGSGPILL